jgi:hypothetical protein
VHVQIVNFSLQGVNDSEFRAMCDRIAPEFAKLSAMISKT